MEYTNMLMDAYMKVTGSKIDSMVVEKFHTKMELQKLENGRKESVWNKQIIMRFWRMNKSVIDIVLKRKVIIYLKIILIKKFNNIHFYI